MYTAKNLKKRKNLQHDPRLLERVQRWWETCMRTATRATGNARTEMEELPKAEFFALNCRLHKALLLTYDEAEALACAEDDWNTDVGPGQKTMTRAAFVSSLLELVDVWKECFDRRCPELLWGKVELRACGSAAERSFQLGLLRAVRQLLEQEPLITS